MQICRLTELAFKLKCLATGMPFGDEPRRRRKEDMPGYWTGPSAEEALEKIYGSKSAACPDPLSDAPPSPPRPTAASPWSLTPLKPPPVEIQKNDSSGQ